ncbi:hypothetical protein V5F40_06645 [Xanthobacter sp. DSM 14520]|uniref:hypothetical protein n=1 Tax=Xanthobacter autotrophicus (strain ATCC BAA-1158 / Py2) TaxID=78245 RepID=UPI00372A5810
MGSSVATPVEVTLSAAGSTAWFSPSPARPFNAWVLAGAWSGSLYLEKSPDGGTTAVPIVVGDFQLYVATRIGVTPVEEAESGVLWRWTAAAGFSGTATVRLSQ